MTFPRRIWKSLGRHKVLAVSIFLTVILSIGALNTRYIAEFRFETLSSTGIDIVNYDHVVEVPLSGVPEVDVVVQSANWRGEDLHLKIRPDDERQFRDQGTGQQIGPDQVLWVGTFGSTAWPLHSNHEYSFEVTASKDAVLAYGKIRVTTYKVGLLWLWIGTVISMLSSVVQVVLLIVEMRTPLDQPLWQSATEYDQPPSSKDDSAEERPGPGRATKT